MRQFDLRTPGHLAHSGTYHNNVFTMTVRIPSMGLVTAEEIQRINVLGDRVGKGINGIVKRRDLQRVDAVGFGSAVGLRVEGGRGMPDQGYRLFCLVPTRNTDCEAWISHTQSHAHGRTCGSPPCRLREGCGMYFKGMTRGIFCNKTQHRGWGLTYPGLAFILRFQDILSLRPNSGFWVAGIE